jgi:hypothetical protein
MKTYFKPPKWLVINFLILLAAQLIGQNTNKINKKTPDYRFGLKAYLGVSHYSKFDEKVDANGNIATTTQSKTEVLPTFGVSKLKKNGSLYELSFTHLNFKREDIYTERTIFFTHDSLGNLVQAGSFIIPSRGARVISSHIGMRFEWDYPILKNLIADYMDKVRPFVGISIDPSVFYENIVPHTTATFPTIAFEARNTISIIPKIIVELSPRLFLDVHAPIAFVSAVATYAYEANPILPTYARNETSFSTKFFPPLWNIRLGLGYRI